MTEAQALKFKDLCGRQLTEPPAEFLNRLVKLEGASVTLRTSEFVGVRGCQADERACEQLVAAFKLLDKRMMEAAEKESQKK